MDPSELNPVSSMNVSLFDCIESLSSVNCEICQVEGWWLIKNMTLNQDTCVWLHVGLSELLLITYICAPLSGNTQ